MNLLNLISLLCFVTLVTCLELSFFPKHGYFPLLKPRAKAGPVTASSVRQPLDQFDPQNQKYWDMRFMFNGEFFKKPDDPIFVFLGGEWNIDADKLQGGQMYDMAQQNNAFMLYTEHRYYGYSYPTNNLDPASIQYLFNTDQALADVVNLIRILKANYPEFKNSKVVVVGGSYAGNMAIWIREKYPDDIFAAVASSAPVHAKRDFTEYFEVVKSVLGKECSGIISRAIDHILHLFGTPEGADKVHRDFNTCKPINTNKPMEVSAFIGKISTALSGVVQYDTCGQAKQLCDSLINAPNMDDYSKLVALFNGPNQPCVASYDDMIEYFENTAVIPGDNNRQWFYQVCFQIGYMQVSSPSKKKQIFREAITMDTYNGYCTDFFGSNVYNPEVSRRGVDRTNMIYGGLNPNVTRVVSVHGGSDPWHKLGLKEDLNPLAPVIVAKGASHVFDLASINSCDNEEMVAAKLAVQSYIKEWLNAA